LGTAACSRTPGEDRFAISCESDYEGFDLRDEIPGLAEGLESIEALPYDLPSTLTALLRTEARRWSLDAAWTAERLAVAAVTAGEAWADRDLELGFDAATGTLALRGAGGDVITDTVTNEEALILMPHEWAWRLSAMPLELPYGGAASLVQITDEGRIEIYDAFVNVVGGEPVWTPAGNYVTWKVTVSYTDAADRDRTMTAWYDSEAPHILVRYDDGAVSYLLSQAEAVGQTPIARGRASMRRWAP
jgi:hypothetical protein